MKPKRSEFLNTLTTLKTVRRGFGILLILIFSLGACNQGNYVTVKHVKPVNHNRYYNPKKDKKRKRVKYKKMKILKRSPNTPKAPAKSKVKTKPPAKKDTVQYESDTTGFL